MLWIVTIGVGLVFGLILSCIDNMERGVPKRPFLFKGQPKN